jgi:hypothetical protein
MTLSLAGDLVVTGNFRSTDGQVLTLLVDGKALDFDLALVESAQHEGDVIDPETLRTQAEDWAMARIELGPRPHPLLVGAASAILPGSGHLILRDWRIWAGYAIVDGALLGLASWFGFHEQARGPATTFLVIDGIFRVYAVQEAVRDARRRRPADPIGSKSLPQPCRAAFSLVPLAGGGVVAAAGYQCGSPIRLEEIGLIH